MKQFRLRFCCLFLAVAPAVHADYPGIQEPAGYSSRIEGRNGPARVFDSATDGAGNVYVVGSTVDGSTGQTNIDVFRDREDDVTGRPGRTASISPILGAASYGFIIKYDRDGNVIWRRAVGDAGASGVTNFTGVTTDASGKVFVTGTMGTVATFGNLPALTASARSNSNFANTLSSAQVAVSSNVFVAMIDGDGVWQWARQFDFAVNTSTNANVANLGTEAIGSSVALETDATSGTITQGINRGRSVVIDSTGSLYLKLRLASFTAGNPAANANRVFWLRSETAGYRVAAAAVDGAGTATEYFRTPFIAKLLATPPPIGAPAGSQPTYSWRWVAPVTSGVVYNAAGTITSIAPVLNTEGNVNGMGVDPGDGESLFLTGDWKGNLVAGGAVRLPFTANDGFVARWRSSDAAPLYLATFSASLAAGGASRGGALVVDADKNAYVTGSATNAAQLRLTSADAAATNVAFGGNAADRTSFFVGKINASGSWLWTETPVIGTGAAAITATTLTRDTAGALYIAGASAPGNTATLSPGVVVRGGSYSPLSPGISNAFVAKLTEGASTRTWNWALETEGTGTGSGRVPKWDTAALTAGTGGTIYWSVAGYNTQANGRFIGNRSPNTADRDFDTIFNPGVFLLPVRDNAPAISPQFSLFTKVVCGTEVTPPAGVYRDAGGKTLQPEITLPAAGNANGATSFYWDAFEAKLYAVRPEFADIRWKVTSNPLSSQRIVRRVETVWPTVAQGLVTHVTGAGPNGDEPKVALESPAPSFNHTFQSVLYNGSQAAISGAKIFSAKGSGYSVLLYTVGKNTVAGSAAVSLEVVRTFLWTDPAVIAADTAVIGQEISGAAYNHGDPTGKNGYIVNAKARFDGAGPGAAYDRTTQLGTIIPVNTDEPGTDDDMVIIWSSVNSRGVAWPAKPVTYTCSWPGGASLGGVIIIASQLGSECLPADSPLFSWGERLPPAKYQTMSIYHQPDKNLPGYNPNEEHALLAPSNSGSGFQAVFALRSDLNHLVRTTSDPFVLLRYQDATDGLKTKMRVFVIIAETTVPFIFPVYPFSSFAGTAGTRVQPPYPISLLGDAAGTTGGGLAYYKDRKNQVWAKSAGTVTARYFYPLQPNFWYDTDGDGVQDTVSEAPWLDRLAGGTVGLPKEVSYTISWPPNVPQLAVGDTLTTERDGMPDVEAMASASVIYEEASSVRLIDYATERKVSLDGTIDGQNFVLGSLSLPVELVTGGRYRFRDLPPHLKSRVTFDPVNKFLVFSGYKEVPPAGRPLVLLNVMSRRERDRLLAFDGTPASAAWDTAINVLYALSRNPNLVAGAAAGDYYAGLKGSTTSLSYATAQGPKALTAGKAAGLGYVTLVENDAPGLGAAPIALHILRVVNPPVTGDIKVLLSENALDEKITLRHGNDFAGDPDGLTFEWWYKPATTSTSPPAPVNPPGEGWISLASGAGVNDVTIEGAGLRTLSDSWVFCRYRGYTAGGNNPLTFTDWAGDPASTPLDRRAVFVPGWIKRVLEGINGFEARVKDFGAAPTQTYSSFVSQAGTRYEGAIALNSDPAYLNSLGLIPLYETVLRRGLSLSLDGTPPQTNDAVNNALLLASTRISDLYTLLGHEAYADAQDPTIGFTSADGEVGSLAPSVYSFANQLPSLIDEELALLRGRDNSAAGTGAAPVYNRLFWNFTNGLEGEPVYVQNYGIADQNADGFITEADAAKLFPQGHGDAWGHYLTAVSSSYRLLRHPGFTWIPRSEPTTVGGVAIEVDYLDERKFANAAAARATCGAEIVNLTYRDRYVADPAGQWQGYRDTDTVRAWGVDEWARRAGQGAYFDWLTANAILPAVHTAPLGNPGGPAPTGLQKIDRTTVPELAKIAAALGRIQSQVDQADRGLNPLGVTPGTVPFDIDPAFLIIGSGIQGTKHFEQIYERTIAAVNGARRIFDHANELTQRLRQTQISSDEFAQDVRDQENDFRSRLIEIFGYPYAGDIGTGKTYPTGYIGPDIYHYNYVAVTEVSGTAVQPDNLISGFFKPIAQDYPAKPTASQPTDFQQVVRHYFTDDVPDPTVSNPGILKVDFPIATGATASRWAFAAPSTWGQRRAPGALQLAISDMVRAEAELLRGRLDYDNHIKEIQDQVALLNARFNVQSSQINILNTQKNTIVGMNKAIGVLQAISISTGTAADVIEGVTDGLTETIPKGLDDFLSALRGGLKVVGKTAFGVLKTIAAGSEIAASSTELGKEEIALSTEIQIQKEGFKFEVQEHLKVIEALLREEIGLRLDLFNLQQSLADAVGNYQKTLAEGQELLEERKRYRQRVAGAVQQNRYQDLTFRVFRNEALQKYRAAFDLAARYVYMAATTYDYETCQLGSNAAAGRRFLTDIVRERALGQYLDDDPVPGVNGLSDPLGRLNQNFQVLKTRLGINNPQIESNRFSLRRECFRIREDSDEEWRTLLQSFRVADLWKVPEFRRFCRPFAPESAGAQPGLVIPFSTDVTFGQNYFGLPLGGGDASYDSTNFSTKINAVGVWFGNYDPAGLSTTPRVYLVPVGLDIMRAPDNVSLATREFDVVDQAIPVPFPIGSSDLTNPDWMPGNNLESPIGEIRRFNRFRAYHDDGYELGDFTKDSRLVGRSVWNTKWMLIIPGGTFLNDPNAGLDTFISGQIVPGTQRRDGNGNTDIQFLFETYGYSGN